MSQGSMFIFQDCRTAVGEVPKRDTNLDLGFRCAVAKDSCRLKLDPIFLLQRQVCHLKLDPLFSIVGPGLRTLKGVRDLGRRSN